MEGIEAIMAVCTYFRPPKLNSNVFEPNVLIFCPLTATNFLEGSKGGGFEHCDRGTIVDAAPVSIRTQDLEFSSKIWGLLSVPDMAAATIRSNSSGSGTSWAALDSNSAQ